MQTHKSSQDSVAGRSCAWMQRAGRPIALGLLLCVALLPGCRLYEFITGTGSYHQDPFGGAQPTPASQLDAEHAIDDIYEDAYDDPYEDAYDEPYVEEDFSGETLPIESPDSELARPDALPADSRRARPPSDAPRPEFPKMPEEEPRSDNVRPLAPPPDLDDIDPGALDEPQMTPEDPFPFDLPPAEPPPAERQPSADPWDDLLADPRDKPLEPDGPSEPAVDTEQTPDGDVDELDLFDDAISPDLQLDPVQPAPAQTPPDEGADLPHQMYPRAERPDADSFFGRCLFPRRASGRSPRIAADGGPRERSRPNFSLSESTEIVPPRPGNGIFDTALPGRNEPQSANVPVVFDEDVTPEPR
jgi:hypothetical protein